MKKIITLFFAISFIAVSAGAQTFQPNLALLTTYEQSENPSEQHHQPYIAIFKKDGKTLIYLASKHYADETLDMVDYVFANFKPKIAVVEFERSGRMLRDKCSRNEFEYSAGIASDKNIPVVLADLPDDEKIKILSRKDPNAYKTYQAKWMINNSMMHKRQFGTYTTADGEVQSFTHFAWKPDMPEPMTAEEFKIWFKERFNEDFDTADLNEIFKEDWTWPLSTGTIFNKLSEDMDFYARDPFIVKNIAAALNKYKTVYAAFGEGHYRTHRKISEDMLGKPEYIWDVEYKDRNNCQGFQIKKVILVPEP
ncbi:MAG: hypothetical protein LBL61_07665 [Elusimicrobiota bacterium]|jgi:hypothetical protein|nr:hypothetical protein [Elusimicrobiota bacterium]